MPSVPSHASIQRGSHVSIVLKADQSTGRQVQGIVADLLTRGNHPRGVKVLLSDGRVGRVQALMASDGHHTSSDSTGGGHTRQEAPQGGYGGQQQQQQPIWSSPPIPRQSPRSGYPPQTHSSSTTQPLRPADASSLLDAEDGTAQRETMESYENARPATKEEEDRAALGREFPSVDGSLVAALYLDCEGDVSGTREMLQAVSGSDA